MGCGPSSLAGKSVSGEVRVRVNGKLGPPIRPKTPTAGSKLPQ